MNRSPRPLDCTFRGHQPRRGQLLLAGSTCENVLATNPSRARGGFVSLVAEIGVGK